jgi:hypothetical protein
MSVSLTTEEVYELGGGDMISCDWDLSKIPGHEYEPFFLGLGNVLYKKVAQGRFSIASLHELEASDSGVRNEVDDSIASKVCRDRRRLLKVFRRVLPVTKTLKSLIIDRIPFSAGEVNSLLQAAARSPRLESLILVNVNVTAAAFRQFLRATSPAQFQQIVFQNCGLSDIAATDAIRFLRSAPPGKWKLMRLDLPDNEIDGETLSQIDDLVSRRGAVDFEENVKRVLVQSIQAKVDQVPHAKSSKNPFAENQNLRNELAALLEAAGVLPYSDEVFLIGPSAAANLRIIRECERRVGEDPRDK